MKKYFHNRGFMVIEVLITASIITVSILASMMVAQKSIYVSRRAFHTIQAGFLLEEGTEAVRTLRDSAWNNISSLAPSTTYFPTFSDNRWILSSTTNTVGIFTRAVSISGVNRDNITKDIGSAGVNDPGTKLITVTVSWAEGGVILTKALQFYIINIFS